MRAALTILVKDLRLRTRDRSAFVVGVLAPFGLAFILNLVTGGLSEGFSATYGVVDLDRGAAAEGFVEVLEGMGDDFDIETGYDERAARQHVEDGDVDAVFVIPEGFTNSVASPDTPAQIRVIGDVDAPIATEVARSVASGFAARLNAVRLSVGLAVSAELGQTIAEETGSQPGSPPTTAGQAPGTGGGGGAGGAAGDAPDLEELLASARQQEPPVRVADVTATDRQLDGTTYLMAGMAVFFVFFTVQFGVIGLLEERQEGTMVRLLAAPIPRLAVPLAKALTSLVLGVAGVVVLALASTLLMGADWGPPLAVAVLIVAVVLAAVSLVGVVAGLARTAEQAAGVQSVLATVLGMLGGSFFPIAVTEGLITRLSALTPHYWFLRGLGDARAGGLADAVPSILALLTFTLVVGSIGAAVLVRRTER